MNPSAPPQVKGRILDFPSGYNLSQRPKAYEPVTFEVLRNLADGYDLLRIIIETRKDQMSRLKWNIVPRAHAKKKSKQPEMIEAIEQIERFFVRPDGTHFWADWLRLVLEDLLVLDAPAIYRRRTYGGSLYALEPIDGSTIKRVIDDWGRTPQYPVTAYQQVLKGLPALDYTTRDLIYRPRNLRTHKVYGFSPVEQILMTVNIGMRRQVWQLQSFTEGTIPEALIGTPSTWTPDQIRAFQDYFDSLLQGNTGERRRARFVPGELAKGYVATKPSELFGEAEEWLIRVVCFAFGVSAQPFVKMMNRATAETAQESAAEEGLAPIQNWVKGFMDSIILDDFENEDLEFEWLDEDELDPKTKSEILDKDTGNGLMTLNEARGEKGLDPYDHPDASRPMFKGAQGYTPIFKTPEEQAEADAMKQQLLGAAGAAPGDEEVPEGEEEEGKGPTPPPAIQVPAAMVKSNTQEDGTEASLPFGHVLVKVGAVKGSKVYVDPDRDDAVLAVKTLKRTIAKTLRVAASSISEQIRAKLSELGKADTPEDPIDIDDILNSLDIVFFNDDADDIAEDLEGVFRTAGTAALAQVGSEAITNEVNDRAVEWAREHAAELAGLTDNEDYSLDASTRAMLRGTIVKGLTDNIGADAIAEAIKETYAFSDERAELIAMTEIASANSLGALAGYEEAQRSGIKLGKSWLILEDACEICHENEDAGVIELDETFPSGDLAPPAHPNCRCVLVPEVEGEEQDPEETMELMAKALLPRDVKGRFNTDPGKTFLSTMVTGIPGVKAKPGHKFFEHIQDDAEGDVDTSPLGKQYNEDQERDDNGRFGSGSGDKNFAEVAGESSVSTEEAYDLTDAQLRYCAMYSEMGYEAVNTGLRGGDISGLDPASVQIITNLDEAIHGSTMKEDAVVYRGLSAARADKLGEMIGEDYKDAAFVSTSKNPDIALGFSAEGEDNIVLAITVPAGNNALDMTSEKSTFSHEKEVLLPRGSSFRVDGVTEQKYGNATIKVVHVTHVNPGAKS